MSNAITEATSKVHALLEPLSSEERRRVVQAVLTLLGDDVSLRGTAGNSSRNDPVTETDDGTTKLSAKANAWIKKHGLSLERLEQFFHFDNGDVSCIELAGGGKSRREKTIHTYHMLGVAALLGKGEAEFTDDEARQLCEHFGCYDGPNHAKTMKEFGNAITGSKSGGWKMTAPGLTAAAELIKS